MPQQSLSRSQTRDSLLHCAKGSRPKVPWSSASDAEGADLLEGRRVHSTLRQVTTAATAVKREGRWEGALGAPSPDLGLP